MSQLLGTKISLNHLSVQSGQSQTDPRRKREIGSFRGRRFETSVGVPLIANRMSRWDPEYVLAPFQSLVANSHNNVLLALRIVERVKELPPPTSEELESFQLLFDARTTDFEQSRSAFKRWVLLNGFQDVIRSIRVALERLIIFEAARKQKTPHVQIEDLEEELNSKVSELRFPDLIKKVSGMFDERFQYLRHAESFNAARNCLQHTNGVVTKRHCNNAQKDKIVIHGHRLKMFFKKDDQDVPAKFYAARTRKRSLDVGGGRISVRIFNRPTNRALA